VWAFFGGVTLAAVAIAALVWSLYASADRVLKRLGEGGARVLSRLVAFLLLCIGVQIMVTGAESILGPWLLHTARSL
jgi:multiple antibiotic resistance protein